MNAVGEVFCCDSCGKKTKLGEMLGWRVFVCGKLQQVTCPECAKKKNGKS
jgi:hypothetical protein